MTLSELVGEIDSNRQQGNLSSAIRLFVLDYFRTRAMAAVSESRPQAEPQLRSFLKVRWPRSGERLDNETPAELHRLDQ